MHDRTTSRTTTTAERGFSLIELLIVVLVIGIIGGIAVARVDAMLTMARADSVAFQVVSLLRYGRDAAIAQRRTVDVVFVPPNGMVLRRNDLPVGTTPIASLSLENGGQFRLNDGPPDTPDGFGRGSEIDFGGAATIRFQPDGTLTDGAAIPVNGTVYLARPNQPLSQRAVTVTGTTARSQPYRWTGTRWETQ